jgi:hypothetical protein
VTLYDISRLHIQPSSDIPSKELNKNRRDLLDQLHAEITSEDFNKNKFFESQNFCKIENHLSFEFANRTRMPSGNGTLHASIGGDSFQRDFLKELARLEKLWGQV